jgi:response regulator RpfG family c-di-GMP phosphodiesterase
MQDSNSKKHKILYIGEKTEILKQFQEAPESCEIIQVENALNANTKLDESDDIDAIISEYYLPGMNGVEIFIMKF